MEKKVILTLAAFAAALGMSAETYVFDFKTNPAWTATFYEEGESEVSLIDTNTCNTLNLDSGQNGIEMRNGEKVIDLEDGTCVDAAEANLNHCLVCHTDEYPSRVHLFKANGATGENYGAATPEDEGATSYAIAFLRPKCQEAQGSRKNTFVQFPTVQGPFKVTAYLGYQGGNYSSYISAKCVPMVNGEEGEAFYLEKGNTEGDATECIAKRYYKFEHEYAGEGPVNLRVGCNGHELLIYHLEIEELDGTGVNAVVAADNDNVVYNILGQKVDASYKGLVIKNGKKLIQK